jgi:NADP-dependent 3-hydroxy acid dehydrogenase YdfG
MKGLMTMPNDKSPAQLPEFQTEDVAGKSILLTGGTTGIGRATARLLVWKGANVFTFGRTESDLNEALADIKAVGGGEIYGTLADSSNPEDVSRVFQEADRQLGGLDVLINNAALGAGSILDSDYTEWHSVVMTNLMGYMSCSKEAIERMKRNKRGHIVNVGSMSAKVREAGSDVYVATKSAIKGFTDSLAKQANKEGIQVTLIEPGLAGSDMTTDQTPPEEQNQRIEAMEMMKAEDVAQCVYYCLSQPQRVNVALVQIRPLMHTI